MDEQIIKVINVRLYEYIRAELDNNDIKIDVFLDTQIKTALSDIIDDIYSAADDFVNETIDSQQNNLLDDGDIDTPEKSVCIYGTDKPVVDNDKVDELERWKNTWGDE